MFGLYYKEMMKNKNNFIAGQIKSVNQIKDSKMLMFNSLKVSIVNYLLLKQFLNFKGHNSNQQKTSLYK